MYKKTIFLIIIFYPLISCAPTIKNFDRYEKNFISKTQFMPDENSLSGKPPKIAVFDFDEGEIEVAKQAMLGKSIAKNIESIISKFRLAEVIDRSASSKLQQEIALSEMNKTGSYKGPKIADYAISGNISNATFSNKYRSGSTFIDPKTRQVVSIPPSFLYRSEVAGNIKIYELPSLTVIETIEISGDESRTENVQQDGGVSFGGIQIGGKQEQGIQRDDGLVRNAGKDAVEDAESMLRNNLSKRGFVLEKRNFKDNSIFKISIGSEDGIGHGDKFEVISQYETENPITGKAEIERRIIATGKVTNLIDPKSSWIIIDNKDQESKIRLGDIIKMKYSKSKFKSFVKVANKALN